MLLLMDFKAHEFMIYYATLGKEVKKMNRSQFLNQVDAAIEIGDSKLIRRLIIIARKIHGKMQNRN